MIFYFTGNGNSRWVARQIAEATHDEAVNISDYIRGKRSVNDIAIKDVVGIIFPTHSWYAPLPVIEFAKHLNVPEGTYRYAITTCGDNVGKGMKRFAKHFHLDAAWSVVMPNTYIPMFALDSEELAERKLQNAYPSIAEIATIVNARQKTWNVLEGIFPQLKTYIIYPLFIKGINTKKFKIEGECKHCGTCAKVCPMGNITIKEDTPVWGDNCTTCMACVNSCPAAVIQYGKGTRKRGRYNLLNVEKNLRNK